METLCPIPIHVFSKLNGGILKGMSSTNKSAVAHFESFTVLFFLLCIPWYISIHCRHPVAEHNDAHYGGRYEQLSVNAKPCKVETNFLSKVLPVGIRSGIRK